MFWRKALHVLVISILLVGGFAAPSGAEASRILAKTAITKSTDTTVIYVDVDAPGPTYDGTSWATAYKTVQDALTTANIDTQIWVAEGVYYPDEGAGQTNDVITSTFVLTDSMALYGGFMGSEVSLEERDWEANVTVLSGDIDGNDITDSYGVVTNTTNITGENAYHVVYSEGVTSTAIIDGFTITAGQANGAYPDNYGGGMYNSSSSPTLRNATFSGNSTGDYGGGMYNEEFSDPRLTDVTFSGNSAGLDGGGMYNRYYSNPTLTKVSFSNNSAEEWGGGLYNVDNSHPILTNVTFSGNSAGDSGGGMRNVGTSHPTLTNVTFSGNSASNDGGGMQNVSYDGSNPATLTNVTFSDNSAGGDGGGMYNIGSPTLTNVKFINNSAGTVGGGMSGSGNPTLINVTFSGNSAGYWGGMCVEGFPTLTNVIMWDNTPNSQTCYYLDPPTISFSDIQGCGGSDGWVSACGIDGGGNIDADPLFVDALNDDLHLGSGSPAIDAGDDSNCPLTDLDGVPRPQGEGCDMGAYEFFVNAPPIAVDDDGIGFTTYEDTPFTTASVLSNDTDPDGDILSVISFDDTGTLGQVTSNANGTFDYDPNGQFEDLDAEDQDTDSFTYTISDGNGGTDSASVMITIDGLDDTSWIYLPLVVGE